MALDKNGKPLPKGITWLEKKQLYMARFTYQGTPYTIYDKELKVIKKKLTDKRYEVEHGISGKADKVTLNEWFDIWVREFKKDKIKLTTLNTYESTYNAHIRDSIGKRYLSQIKLMHIQKLYNELTEKGLAPNTICKIHVQLNGMFATAVNNDLIIKNPCKGVELPTIKKKEMRIMDAKEQDYFLKYIRQERWQLYEPAITVLLGTGLRLGELLALEWQDVDLKNKTISVTKNLVYTKDRITNKYSFKIETPKTPNSVRTIPLLPYVEQAFKRQKHIQNLMRISGYFESLQGFEKLVFTTKNGKPQKCKAIQRALTNIVCAINKEETEKAQKEKRSAVLMEHLHPHALRHSFATRCFEKGIPIKTVQMLLGHSKIEITMNLYVHLTESKKIEDMQKLNDLFVNVV